jgi:hypothetical protein
VSQAVCRNCWTWYGKGETVCPTCRLPLMMADAGAPAFNAGAGKPDITASMPPAPSAGPPPASPAAIGWARLLPVGGVIAIAVIAVAIFASLNIGGPAKASDGSFSVKAPRGWAPSTTSQVDGYAVLLALAAMGSNGVKNEFAVADFGQLVPLSAIENNWQLVLSSGKLPVGGTLGALTRTTVGGAPALEVDYQSSKFSGELLFIDYGGKTYIAALTSAPADFQRLRQGDFASMLSSWQWLH